MQLNANLKSPRSRAHKLPFHQVFGQTHETGDVDHAEMLAKILRTHNYAHCVKIYRKNCF